jgi:hypothetical protein
VRPFIIQVYARDMANGVTVMTREIEHSDPRFRQALGWISLRL